MSLNEVIIFFVLIAIGSVSGLVIGTLAAERAKGLFYGLVRGCGVAVGVTLLILFPIAITEVWGRSASIFEAFPGALGVTLLYGFGCSLVSGGSALLASYMAYRASL